MPVSETVLVETEVVQRVRAEIVKFDTLFRGVVEQPAGNCKSQLKRLLARDYMFFQRLHTARIRLNGVFLGSGLPRDQVKKILAEYGYEIDLFEYGQN